MSSLTILSFETILCVDVCDDLILMAECEVSLCEKIVKWKSWLEAKGLKINKGKTKVMFSCNMKDKVEVSVSGLVVLCKKGVCNNSILCYS